MHIGDIATVLVDDNLITGTVYHVRENGWPCVQTEAGRMASGPIAPVNFWEHVTYWRGTKRRPDCPNCGGSPMGEGCYHICHNSVHYYSPEQERRDAMLDDGSDDIRERYAATIEPSQYEPDEYVSLADCCKSGQHLTSCDDDGYCNFCGHQDACDDSVALTDEVVAEIFRTSSTDTDDIPF